MGSALLLSCTLVVSGAQAGSPASHRTAGHGLIPPHRLAHENFRHYPAHLAMRSRYIHSAHFVRHAAIHAHGISCVPYAREVSGIHVIGNAWQWWNNAEGHYARGHRPEVGSVLNFRSNGRMRLGHVAVVVRVVNAREVMVDHANWPTGNGPGSISRDVAVVDVSEANNWSAVRVELGRGGEFGSVYPTYGFIYNRPDAGVVTASISRPAPLPAINPVPSDLRPVAERPWHTTVVEVAEAPSKPARQIDLRVSDAGALR